MPLAVTVHVLERPVAGQLLDPLHQAGHARVAETNPMVLNGLAPELKSGFTARILTCLLRTVVRPPNAASGTDTTASL